MPKEKVEDLRGRNPLTEDEAAALGEEIADALGAGVGKLFLLIHVFTYVEPDERESLSSTIESRILHALPGIDSLRHDAMRRAVEGLRKGGA